MARAKKEQNAVTRPKRVTMEDIAKLAGVKKMTVSDALNDTRSVAPATRARIKQIAKELNYIPNFAARALSTGRTGIVAVLSGALNEPYYAEMVHLLEKHITGSGYHLMLMRSPREVHDLVSATGNVAVDGAIAVDALDLVDEFRSHPTIPCVAIGTSKQTFVDSVSVDLSDGVREAMALMLNSGRRRIAYFVTSASLAMDWEVRARAYRATMQDAQLTSEIINVQIDDLDLIEARLKEYFQKNGCPEGLLCLNDQIAMCAFGVLRDMGYRVPDDVLLVGCDGQPHMKYFDPPLSTIIQPMPEMCAKAWQFLQARMAQPDLPHQSAVLQGTLQVRQSLAQPCENARFFEPKEVSVAAKSVKSAKSVAAALK